MATKTLAEKARFVRRREMRRLAQQSLQSKKNTPCRAQKTSMLGRIQRHIGADLQCSRDTIRAAKCAAAWVHHNAQIKSIEELPRADPCMIQLSVDETEMTMGKTVKDKQGQRRRVLPLTVPLMMLHAVFASVGPIAKTCVDVICPPCILQSTSAQCLLNAVQKRMPLPISKAAQRFGGVFVILMTDAAKSCKKLGRLLGKLGTALHPVVVFHFLCAMHQVSLCVSMIQKPLAVLGAVFCACNLIHKGATWQLVRSTVHRSLDTLDIRLTPPDPQHKVFFREVLLLLEWDTDMLNDEDLARQGCFALQSLAAPASYHISRDRACEPVKSAPTAQMASLELVSGVDFFVQIDIRRAPGRSEGFPGSISGLRRRRTCPNIVFLPPLLKTGRFRVRNSSILKVQKSF